MSRPKGCLNKATIARLAATLPSDLPDEVILGEIKEQFTVAGILTDGAINGEIRSLTIAGGPGVGKSHMVEQKLKDASTFLHTKYTIVSGGISPVGLYKLGYEYSSPGSVIVLDDSDEILDKPEGVSILKALCDSGQYRTVYWVKESAALKDDDGNPIPTSYEFEGTMIFITNRNLRLMSTGAKGGMAPHIKALMDRTLYIDLLIHNRQQLGVWVNHMASATGIFEANGMTKEQGTEIMEYINAHRNDLETLSLRTITKACDLMKTAIRIAKLHGSGVNFTQFANGTLLVRK